MKIYNTLTKQKEEFVPRHDKEVKMFVCGPTVYDYVHIGNARTFVIFDAFAKYLRHRGYQVDYIQNITDIDDKIIKRAKDENMPPLELAKKYENIFLEDMAALDVTAVTEYDKYARATDHIQEVIKQVIKLKEKGHAYLIEGDGYYFDLSTFPEYGKLSGRTSLGEYDAVSRIDENKNKLNKGDFCLWKLSKPTEPSWDSNLGQGRPGWHIEDTAITEHYFGPQYDLHGGGQDLIFPHHEAEIAQQSSAAGIKPEEFVRYWMHTGFLISKKRKMSKSLGNFMSLNEALRIYSSQILRFYFLSAHYRSELDFSDDILKQAEAAVERIGEFKNRIDFYGSKGKKPSADQVSAIKQLNAGVYGALDDDFDTPKAIGIFFDIIHLLNGYIDEGINISRIEIAAVRNLFDEVFGIIPEENSEIPAEVRRLTVQRELARKSKDFPAADKIRSQIEALGYQIDDTAYGPLVKKSNAHQLIIFL